MTALVAVPIALALMAGVGAIAAHVFHHTHASGHCGWSGCQAKETT